MSAAKTSKEKSNPLVPRMMIDGFERDIQESYIRERAPEILETLLIDRTMTAADSEGRVHRIRWCTDDYSFAADAEIAPELISKPDVKIIRPRVDKRIDDQRKRSVDRAEVFTPSWVCNKQNNLVDQAWFGRKTKLFNREITDKKTGQNIWQSTFDPEKRIEFPKGRTWEDYVCANRLEVSCGEAPYLTSRYDTTTGDPIPVEQRIGFLDRKLRVISEQVGADRKEWLEMAEKALKSCYGFEWQGDNVEVRVKPCEGCDKGDVKKHNGVRCRVMDWETGKPVLFMPPFDFKPIEG